MHVEKDVEPEHIQFLRCIDVLRISNQSDPMG